MAAIINTNNVPRECIMGQWLDSFGGLRPGNLYSNLREQFDYLTEDEFDSAEFFKYRGQWYHVGDFIKISSNQMSSFDYRKWDGYYPDTYSSGILMKYCYNGTVIVGNYYS